MQHPIRYAAFLLSCMVISPAIGHDCWGDHHCENGWDYYHHGNRPAARQQGRMSPSDATPALKVIDGKITEIIYLPGASADRAMVEIRMTAGAGLLLIQLAPVGLLKQSQLVLKEGDAVSVTGFEVSAMDGDLLVATEIHKADKRVVLRDTRGRPIW